MRSKRIVIGPGKSRHCQTCFSWNVNLQRKQKWIAKSTNLEENFGQFSSSEQPCECKTLERCLEYCRSFKKIRSENLRLRSTLEVIQFQFWMKGALATVEICVLCSWRFLNHFNILSDTPYCCDIVAYEPLYCCCALRQTGKYASESKVMCLV